MPLSARTAAAIRGNPLDERHGRYSTYANALCRCEDCRRSAREHKAAHRRSGTTVNISDLAAFCWCQAEIVHVPAAEVRAGRTGSCGAPRCKAAS